MQPIGQRAMTPEIITKIDEAGIIAVLVIDELKHALPLAKALLAGGVNSIELTLRTDAALDAAKLIRVCFFSQKVVLKFVYIIDNSYLS